MTAAPHHAGIIAAGQGLRLAKSHPGLTKPLVPVAGKPLCHWVAAGLREAGAREITVLHNSSGRDIRHSLENSFADVSWTFLQADTASSWESFRLVARALAQAPGPFMISTVDALIPPGEVRCFGALMAESGATAGLALTSFVDDEKPLWTDIDGSGRVTALGDACLSRRFVTSGLYYLDSAIARQMPQPQAFSALRGYLAALVDSGDVVLGLPLSKTLDIDRPEDIAQAEGFLREVIAPW